MDMSPNPIIESTAAGREFVYLNLVFIATFHIRAIDYIVINYLR